jgi:hypothetical protein
MGKEENEMTPHQSNSLRLRLRRFSNGKVFTMIERYPTHIFIILKIN